MLNKKKLDILYNPEISIIINDTYYGVIVSDDEYYRIVSIPLKDNLPTIDPEDFDTIGGACYRILLLAGGD